MNIINSETLGREPVSFGEESGLLDTYSGLKTPFTEDVVLLSEQHREQVETIAVASAVAYGDSHGHKEPTFAETKFGLPALVVRVDCTINDGDIIPYEMEDSPSGIGVSDRFVKASTGDDFKEIITNHYVNKTGELPHLIISGARNHGTDDEIVVGRERYHYGAGSFEIPAIGTDSPVIVKAIPGQPESHEPYLPLQERCLAPLVTEGDKSYAVRTDLMQAISDESELLSEDGELISQVIKARLGSMAMGISVYLAPQDRAVFGKNGQVKRGRLVRDLQRYVQNGGALLQKLHPPFQLDNSAGRNNGILRVFTLLDRNDTGEVVATAIGGAYVARPEMIVHGAANAISGAVLVG